MGRFENYQIWDLINLENSNLKIWFFPRKFEFCIIFFSLSLKKKHSMGNIFKQKQIQTKYKRVLELILTQLDIINVMRDGRN